MKLHEKLQAHVARLRQIAEGHTRHTGDGMCIVEAPGLLASELAEALEAIAEGCAPSGEPLVSPDALAGRDEAAARARIGEPRDPLPGYEIKWLAQCEHDAVIVGPSFGGRYDVKWCKRCGAIQTTIALDGRRPDGWTWAERILSPDTFKLDDSAGAAERKRWTDAVALLIRRAALESGADTHRRALCEAQVGVLHSLLNLMQGQGT